MNSASKITPYTLEDSYVKASKRLLLIWSEHRSCGVLGHVHGGNACREQRCAGAPRRQLLSAIAAGILQRKLLSAHAHVHTCTCIQLLSSGAALTITVRGHYVSPKGLDVQAQAPVTVRKHSQISMKLRALCFSKQKIFYQTVRCQRMWPTPACPVKSLLWTAKIATVRACHCCPYHVPP